LLLLEVDFVGVLYLKRKYVLTWCRYLENKWRKLKWCLMLL